MPSFFKEGEPLLCDAHLHLQDVRLAPVRQSWVALADQQRVGAVLVNGTHPGDWPEVLALARGDARILPSFGLHPWRLEEAPPDWQASLCKQVEVASQFCPVVGIGEVGLDRWILGQRASSERKAVFARQQEAFSWQLALAARHNLPLSIHCLKAWGPLREILQAGPLPPRGFLIHAYGGPPDLVPDLVELGAYFSFNGYFAREEKAAKQEAFRRMPRERLLIETDAPAMLLPESDILHPLSDPASGKPLNHPGNLPAVYACASRCLGIPPLELTHLVATNFQRWLEDDEA